jgi:hypothetical protein
VVCPCTSGAGVAYTKFARGRNSLCRYPQLAKGPLSQHLACFLVSLSVYVEGLAAGRLAIGIESDLFHPCFRLTQQFLAAFF